MTKNTYKKAEKEPKPADSTLPFIKDRKFKLAVGFALMTIALFLVVSFVSYLFTGKSDQSVVDSFLNTPLRENGREAQNIFGLLGAVASHFFIFNWFGVISLIFPPFLFNMGLSIAYREKFVGITRSFVFTSFYMVWTSLLLGYIVLSSDVVTEWAFLSGGIGFELAIVLESLMGWGTFLLILFMIVVFNMYFFNITQLPSFTFWDDLTRVLFFWKKGNLEAFADPDISSVLDRVRQEVEEEDQDGNGIPQNPGRDASWQITFPVKDKSKQEAIAPNPQKDEPVTFEIEKKKAEPRPSNEPLDMEIVSNPVRPAGGKATPAKGEDNLELEVAKPEFEEKHTDQLENYDPTLDLPRYRFPTPDLLFDYPVKDVTVSREELATNKDKIVETLINFKIGISSIKATIGPTVTLYEIVPEAGVKISKIKNLEDDIALSLSALGIRIIAPIPGKGTIGIEVPNKNREMVDIKSVITTEKFMKSDKELPVVLGKTISNEVYVTDLTKMPHLLMAGATGQGKSVGLNIILASLLYKKHPSQLKLILVDPKKVELTLFNKIERHFLAKLPDSDEAIITDTSKVVYTLNSLCIEMDNRYDLLKEAGCRNLKEYNKKFVSRRLNPKKGHRFLPYIVVVIDELADLMMTAGKEVETPIARLAQLARAIGIHLIVATQRPSVNVITGIIKANFPARLSFRVTSKVDSRTILDAGGAEQLIGMGDMLLSQGSEIIRLQCGFVDTPEIEAICDFIGEQRGYDSAYLLPEFVGEDDGGVGTVDLSDRDALFEEAARIIVIHQQGSTSLIQRKMKLGYNRAGRIIDQLEAAGIVGPFEGSKAREVLIRDEYSLEQLLSEIGN